MVIKASHTQHIHKNWALLSLLHKSIKNETWWQHVYLHKFPNLTFLLSLSKKNLHPRKLTWNLKIIQSKKDHHLPKPPYLGFQPVNFPGCIPTWLVVEPTPLKNMLVKMGSSSPSNGENKKYLKPPSSHIEGTYSSYPTFNRVSCSGYIDPNNWKRSETTT